MPTSSPAHAASRKRATTPLDRGADAAESAEESQSAERALVGQQQP